MFKKEKAAGSSGTAKTTRVRRSPVVEKKVKSNDKKTFAELEDAGERLRPTLKGEKGRRSR